MMTDAEIITFINHLVGCKIIHILNECYGQKRHQELVMATTRLKFN